MDLLSLAHLLAQWPRDGATTHAQAIVLRGLAAVDPRVSRDHLRHAVLRTGVDYYSPSPYSSYLRSFEKPSGTAPSRSSAIVIRPGSTLPIALNGHNTTATVDSARRFAHGGKPTHLKITLVVNTEKLPIILQNETKCACLYCGTEPRGNDRTCRSCGAPLPDC
jgi:hypothetical protein